MAPPRKHEPVTKTCEVCGSPFEATSAYQIQKQRCCSRTCSQTLIWKTSRKVKKVKKRCRICGKVIKLNPSLDDVRFTCSIECRGQWQQQSGSHSGENNGQWIGGSSKWWKRKARVRDDFTCQAEGCDVRDEGKGTHAHHKLPKEAGGEDSLENLVTLCDHHHQIAERQLILRVFAMAPDVVRRAIAELYG